MTRHLLDIEYDYDFHLIGINSTASDYRICWNLNQKLDIQLSKVSQLLEIKDKKGYIQSRHSYYIYFDEDLSVNYTLIENRTSNGMVVPEHKSADYLLLIDNNPLIECAAILAKVKQIDQVIMAFLIDINELKSKENLLI